MGSSYSYLHHPDASRQPLLTICETLYLLGRRAKRKIYQYLKEYAAAQARNRGVNAPQGKSERRNWEAEELQTCQRREGV
jgi:hypothetical protein